MILIITISTFVCVSLGVMAVYWFVARSPAALNKRLARLEHSTGSAQFNQPVIEDNPVAAIVERVAEPLNRLVPPSAAEARKIQLQLMQAGYRSHDAPKIYRSIQLVTLFAFPIIVAFYCWWVARPLSSATSIILFAFVAGFFLPRFILKRLIKSRQQRLRWGLADALDLMVISIEAGLGLNSAMVRVSDELKSVHPDISKEFELVNLEIRVGREREEALRNLAERTGVEDLRSLTAMLIQADRFGTSIAKAVRIYSDSLRTKRRQRAEQAAQKAAVKLLLPLTCFLFPTLFIVMLGPAALHLMDSLGSK